jgi:hypothetical protein
MLRRILDLKRAPVVVTTPAASEPGTGTSAA